MKRKRKRERVGEGETRRVGKKGDSDERGMREWEKREGERRSEKN